VLLQCEERLAYCILKRRFALNDENLEELKADLIDAKQLAGESEVVRTFSCAACRFTSSLALC